MRSFRYQSEHIQEINRNNTPEDVYVRGDIQRSHERWLAVQDYDGFSVSIVPTPIIPGGRAITALCIFILYRPATSHTRVKTFILSGK